jgi:hypothetical protein
LFVKEPLIILGNRTGLALIFGIEPLPVAGSALDGR